MEQKNWFGMKPHPTDSVFEGAFNGRKLFPQDEFQFVLRFRELYDGIKGRLNKASKGEIDELVSMARRAGYQSGVSDGYESAINEGN